MVHLNLGLSYSAEQIKLPQYYHISSTFTVSDEHLNTQIPVILKYKM